jgi:homoserine kinase
MSTRTPDPQNQSAATLAVGHEVVVPGSTSNFGAGFDAVGLALSLSLRVRIERITHDGRGALSCRFEGTPLEGENAIARAFRYGLDEVRPSGHGAPSLEVSVRSEIPMRAGLGSSAAALVAGLRLAEMAAGAQDAERLLRGACELEGHPDNASAAVLGGFVVSARLEDGRVVARTCTWPPHWLLVVATPAAGLDTSVARAALPQSVALEDAVFNVQRTALLVYAVHHADSEALGRGLADRLHQPARAALVPGLREALTWTGDGLLGLFLSGAGPSIAAVVNARTAGALESTRERFDKLYGGLGIPVAVRTLRAEPRGGIGT